MNSLKIVKSFYVCEFRRRNDRVEKKSKRLSEIILNFLHNVKKNILSN